MGKEVQRHDTPSRSRPVHRSHRLYTHRPIANQRGRREYTSSRVLSTGVGVVRAPVAEAHGRRARLCGRLGNGWKIDNGVPGPGRSIPRVCSRDFPPKISQSADSRRAPSIRRRSQPANQTLCFLRWHLSLVNVFLLSFFSPFSLRLCFLSACRFLNGGIEKVWREIWKIEILRKVWKKVCLYGKSCFNIKVNVFFRKGLFIPLVWNYTLIFRVEYFGATVCIDGGQILSKH